MANFTPKRNANSMVKNIYREHFLKGDILKMDGGGNDFVEVIDRDNCDGWNLRKNVGSNRGKKISRFPKLFFETISELENDGYLVKKNECDMSGCCQYYAYYYYLVGE